MIVQVLTGVTFSDPTLPILRRDSIITSGTKFVFDFRSDYFWAKQDDGLTNETVINSVIGGSPAILKKDFDYDAGGFVWPAAPSGDNSRYIQLPDSAKLPDTCTGFVACWWLRPSVLLSSLSVSTLPIAGWSYQTDSTQWQYGLSYQLSNNNYVLMADGVLAYADAPLADQLAQLAVEYYDDAGTRKVRAYRNGVLVGLGSSNASGLLNQPNPAQAVSPRIGPAPGNAGASCKWQGHFYRCWLEDTGTSGSSAAEQIAKDWDANNARFG